MHPASCYIISGDIYTHVPTNNKCYHVWNLLLLKGIKTINNQNLQYLKKRNILLCIGKITIHHMYYGHNLLNFQYYKKTTHQNFSIPNNIMALAQ